MESYWICTCIQWLTSSLVTTPWAHQLVSYIRLLCMDDDYGNHSLVRDGSIQLDLFSILSCVLFDPQVFSYGL